eukprot:GFUD01135743.1.p1 GENE.GFUD01135743.1~~GFUD01135743.1.p1  ORF type:complete len:174 (+),score=40.26 GFUD01135743.1:124-645(+)
MILLDMGNICLKKVPAAYEARSVADLAFRVVEKLKDEKRIGDLEKIIEESCANEFWNWWRMSDMDNKILFEYLVLATWLQGAEERGLVMDILVNLRDKFFNDPDKVESVVPFQDTHANGVVVSGVLTELIKNLLFLTEDPVYRDELDPLYKIFLKEMSLKASRRVQHCILSIL